jgi:signal transduction histidine kinase
VALDSTEIETREGRGEGAQGPALFVWRSSSAACAGAMLDPSSNEASLESDSERQVAQLAELAGGLAHELRNPLSTMMINLKLLAEDLARPDGDPDEVRRRALLKVDVLRREGERLQALFDDFLNLTGPRSLRRAEADLNAIVRRLVEFVGPSVQGRGIELETSLGSDPLPCPVDEKLIRQALLNLVLNAQQAMPDGGTLTVSTATEGDRAVISVRDTGVGVSERDRERILRPFFSTKAGGNGLGLSITQRIVHEHGGMLKLESEPGHGAVFRIKLPLRPEGPKAASSAG